MPTDQEMEMATTEEFRPHSSRKDGHAMLCKVTQGRTMVGKKGGGGRAFAVAFAGINKKCKVM